MNFASDNWAGAHPTIAENLVRHAGGFSPAYGASDLDRRVERMFCDVFEREVAVFFVGTGTAANALAVASAARPGGVAFCHRDAHMVEDECGAPEFLSSGVRLSPVDGPEGRMNVADLEAAIARHPPAFVHAGQPVAVSITQATEVGTVHDVGQIAAVAEVCRRHALPLHMDGARFANALVSLGMSPADMTWKAGVDMVSFGGTKNGCWCAEALVFFNPSRVGDFAFIRKRSAQLFSKSRFIAAQFEAYLADDLWLDTARHANAMTAGLAAHVQRSPTVRLAWQPQANELFPVMPVELAERLKAAGAVFYPWKPPHGLVDPIREGETMCRLVTSFATTQEEVDAFGALIA